mgnify:FL=1
MKADLKNLTKTLKASRKALLADYDPEDLHALRVAIRRIRTHLDALADKHSDKQRERWAKIVSRTNSARDWDVFWSDLENVLTDEEFDSIEPVLRERRDKARARVLALLDSRDWSNTMAWWRRYLDETKGHKRREQPGLSIGRIEHRLGKASRKARIRGEDRDWHKLRIAAKELRYTLDERLQSGGGQLEHRIAWCAQLQDSLGNWHDCVVERGLLEELRHELSRVSRQPGLSVIAMLLNRVDARQQACLDEARALLASGKELRING